MQAYYCKNEADLRKVSLYILQSEYQDCIEEQLDLAFVYGCTYNPTEELPERYCMSCVEDDESLDGRCLLYEAIENEEKNIQNKIVLTGEIDDIEYPCVVILHEEDNKEITTIVPISEMKDNTKYGCE